MKNIFKVREKMKALLIHNRYRLDNGENIVVEATSRMLTQKDHEVFVFERNSQNVQGLWGKISAFTESIYSSSAKKALSSILTSEHPDVVHVHNLYPLISPSVLVACRQFDVPVVMTCHNYRLVCPIVIHFQGDNICERCCDGREYWCILKNCRDNIFESLSYALRSIMARKLNIFKRNVTLLIALTEFARMQLFNYGGFPKDRIVVLPNMVSIPNSGVNPSIGEYAIFVGRVSPEKGIDTLLEAAQRLPQLPLRLAGDWSLMSQLVDKKPKNAEFVGFLDRAQLAAFYRKARFLVVPSKWFEMCPLVISEAMSYGLPVIASRIGGLPEIVDDGITGLLFEPGNAEELAEKMKLLWENPDLCRRMGQAGREKAIRDYSEDVYYKRLMDIYEKAVEVNKNG